MRVVVPQVKAFGMRRDSPPPSAASPIAAAPPPPADSDFAAIIGLLLALAAAVQLCVFVGGRLLRPSAGRTSSRAYEGIGENVFETHIWIESADVSCDFTMRLEYEELGSLEQLLDSIARAGFEATELPFDLRKACVERLDTLGHATAIKSDADCKSLRAAAGIRVTKASTGGDDTGSFLLQPHEEDGGDEVAVEALEEAYTDRESLIGRL